MQTVIDRLKKLRLVPVVKLEHAEYALPLGEALLQGGLPIAEITFRTEAAEDAIRLITKRFPDMLVGAGTVINVEQAKRAVGAGSSFLVSPGLSRGVVEYALTQKIDIFPGVCTPTEIIAALEYNLQILKFFPANTMGALAGIKALSPAFPGILFMPTGGITQENMLEYLACEKIIAVGGSWMVKESLIQTGAFDIIRNLTSAAIAQIQSLI